MALAIYPAGRYVCSENNNLNLAPATPVAAPTVKEVSVPELLTPFTRPVVPPITWRTTGQLFAAYRNKCTGWPQPQPVEDNKTIDFYELTLPLDARLPTPLNFP